MKISLDGLNSRMETTEKSVFNIDQNEQGFIFLLENTKKSNDLVIRILGRKDVVHRKCLKKLAEKLPNL